MRKAYTKPELCFWNQTTDELNATSKEYANKSKVVLEEYRKQSEENTNEKR